MRPIIPALAALALAACAPRGAHVATALPAPAPSLGSALAACAGVPLIEPGAPVRASTSGHRDQLHATCAYGASSPDDLYRIHLVYPAHVYIRVEGSFDTALVLRADCTDGDSELACNDDAGNDHRSVMEADLPAGDYFVQVDGYASDHSGFYALDVRYQSITSAPPLRLHARTAMGEGATLTHDPAATTGLTGRVTFAKRGLTPRGLSSETTDRPAEHVDVEMIGAGGETVAHTTTADDGTFTFERVPSQPVRIRAISVTHFLDNDIRVVSDPGTERPYEVSTLPFSPRAGDHVELHAGVGGVEPAGAFNILSRFVHYLPAIRAAFDKPLPALYAFWERGNNASLPEGRITAFLMHYHRRAGTYALQIQGGLAKAEDASDSDQFDDPVILHEFSHFVIHTLAGNYSYGGDHSNGMLVYPAQALDEGGATALGCAVAGDAHYWDTAGVAPGGQLLVDENSETMHLADRGIASQNTAQTVMWDLLDGTAELPDRDDDGVALGVTNVLRLYRSFHDDPNAYPTTATVLERAVSLGMLTAAQATRLTHHPLEQRFTFPVPPGEQWPVDLDLSGTPVHGRIDGRTQPAPSGGPNEPYNGFDATRAYRFTLTARAMVYIDLAIDGSGSQRDGTDLDLTLYTRNTEHVADSAGETGSESIRRFLDAGTYILLVRDGDASPAYRRTGTDGNRATYTLRVRRSNGPL